MTDAEEREAYARKCPDALKYRCDYCGLWNFSMEAGSRCRGCNASLRQRAPWFIDAIRDTFSKEQP